MRRGPLIAGALALAATLLLAYALSRDDPTTRPGSKAPPVPGGPPPPPVALTPGEKPRPDAPGPGPRPGPPADTTPGGLEVRGFVRDVRGAPVPGARVRLARDDSSEATTGADGAFTLGPWGLEPGRRVALVAEGPSPLAPRVVPGVLPGTRNLAIVLRAGEAALSGRVVREGDRSPVRGARIEATTGDFLGRATTDAEGRFRLGGAPAGALGLVVSADGLVPRVATVASGKGAAEVEVVLERGVRLEGRVVRRGSAVAGASVALRLTGVPLPFQRRTATTDAAGAFVFDAIPGCEARLRARTGDGLSPSVVVQSDGAHAPEPVTLELGPGAAVAGRVAGPAGEPVLGAEVVLEDPEDGSRLRAASGPDGRFRLEPVRPEGESPVPLGDVRVRARGFAAARVPAAPEVTVTLRRAASLTVAVSPPEGASVEVEGQDRERRLLREVGRAGAALELGADDLPPGSAWLVASGPGRAPAPRRVELVEGAPLRVEISLGSGVTLEGKVVGDDGAPIAGASVVAIDASSGPIAARAAGTSREDGTFSVAGLGPGTFRVVGSAAGYEDAQLEAASGSRGLVLTLARSYALEVRITLAVEHAPEAHDPDEGGGHAHDAPVGRVLVRLVSPGERLQKTAFARGGAASVLFDEVRGKAWRVEALSPGCAPASVEADPRRTGKVELTLGAGARATGVVVGPDERPLAGAAISRGRDPNEDLHDEGTFATLLGMTEEDGAFAFALAPGGEDVVVTHPEHAPLLLRLEPGEGQKLQLAAGSRISGRTLGPDGRPRGGVGVGLEGPVSKRGVSGPDGGFVLTGLLPGLYRVRRQDASPEAPGVEVSVGTRGESSVELKAP